MSWSTHVNIFWYRKIWSVKCILILYSHMGTYLLYTFYKKINLSCGFGGGMGRTIPSALSARTKTCMSALFCRRKKYSSLKLLKYSKGSAWENISLKQKKKRLIKYYLFHLLPAVKVTYNKVYVSTVIFKNHTFFSVLGILTLKYPLGYLHRKRYRSSNKTSLYCGLQQSKMVFRYKWRKNCIADQKRTKQELILFGTVHFDSWLCTISHTSMKRKVCS